MDDHFEFLVGVIVDFTRAALALERPHVSGCDIVEMPLIAFRREHLGLVEDAQELRHLAQEGEEGAKPLGFPVGAGRQRAGASGDEIDHLQADGRQQLIEQFLPVFEVVIERSLSDFGKLGDARDRCLRITEAADHLGGRIEQAALHLVVPLGAGELGLSCGAYAGHCVQSAANVIDDC